MSYQMLIIIILGLLLLSGVGCTADFVLVEDGKPVAAIVLPKQENPKAARAAAELQKYVEKMSGALLPISSDGKAPAGNAIYVGKSSATDKLGVIIPDTLTNERREEGLVIYCRQNNLVLAGNDKGPYRGTEYAVYDFLNRLGVRWYMPGEFGEHVPKMQNISFDQCNISEKPDFTLRNWWYIGTKKPEGIPEEEELWKLRNKMNPDMSFFAMPGDSSARYVLPESEYFKDRPELFAMNPDGSRNPHLPNLSNPDTVKIVAEKIKEYFRKNPEANSYGFAPDDGLPRDYDPETLKLHQGFWYAGGRPGVQAEASISEEWIGFVNKVIAEVHTEFPEVLIATNGYANRDLAPHGVKTDDKIIIMFAAIWSCTLHAYDDHACWQKERQGEYLREWCRMCRNVWIYGYNYQMLVSGLTPLPETRKLARDFPLMKQWGVMGFVDETRNVWMESGIPSRVLKARLEWSASSDVEEILSDFYNTWYGPAAVDARKFYESIEDVIEKTPMHGHEDRIMPEVYAALDLKELEKTISQAEKLASEEPYRTRVHVDRLIFEHLKNYIRMNENDLMGRWGEAAKQAQNILNIRKELSEISLHFVEPVEGLPYYSSGTWYWTITDRMNYYNTLHELTTGKTGDLVALAPAQAIFRADPYEDGLFKGWYKPGQKGTQWKSIDTTKTFYSQGYINERGYPFLGSIWYKLSVRVPSQFRDRKIMLRIPCLEPEAWLWVNGQYVGHREYLEAYTRPSEMDVDVSKFVKIGENNDITIRIYTGLNAAQACGGLQSRVVLYAPK